jgi:uncharacterized protein (TIGR02001 family)
VTGNARKRGWRDWSANALFANTCAILTVSIATAPAAAQVAASISIKSDDRFRGRSLSDGRPVSTIGLSYDSKSGPYLGGSASAILTGDQRAGLMGAQAYAGYARRTASGVAIDVGIVGYAYTSRYSGNRAEQYVEAYAGLSKGPFSGYVRYAPDYLGRGTPVIYADFGAATSFAPKWKLAGHVGILTQTSGPPGLGGRRVRYDTLIGVSRSFGRLEVQTRWTFAGPDDAYYDGPWGGRSAFVVSASHSF